MPASKAASVQARVCSNPTPPAKVSHEPSEISEISRSEEPSLRYRIMLLAAGARPARGDGRASGTLAEHHAPPQARGRCGGTPSGGRSCGPGARAGRPAAAPARPAGPPGWRVEGQEVVGRLVEPGEQFPLGARPEGGEHHRLHAPVVQ